MTWMGSLLVFREDRPSLFLSDPGRGQESGNLSWGSCGADGPGRAQPTLVQLQSGFSVGRIAVSLVRQPGALGRWQGVRASGRGPLKSHLRGATPTRPLRWKLFWASPEAARLPFLEQQQRRPHAVASGKWGEGRFLLYFQSKRHGLWENFYICTPIDSVNVGKLFISFISSFVLFLNLSFWISVVPQQNASVKCL